MNIRILESANEDIKEGVAFYDQQQKGVGEYFKESIFSDIESLKLFPGAHPVQFEEYHRLLSKRFPFACHAHRNNGKKVTG